MKLFALFVVLASGMLAATWDQLPLVEFFLRHDLEVVQKDFATLHPWKITDPLPTSFKEAGLEAPVELVGSDMYLDGGSHYYLFCGSNGKYLVLCTDSGFYGKNGKTVHVDRPRLFLGAAHFTEKKKVVVPFDSACEKFLLAAIKSEADRLDKLAGPWKVIPAR